MLPYQKRKLSSLAKVFPHRIFGPSYREEIAFWGDTLSFQLALRATDEALLLTASVESDLPVTLSRVGYVPSKTPAYPQSRCRRYLTKKPGLFPDPLFPLGKEKLLLPSGEWQSLFLSVKIPEGTSAGKHTVTLLLSLPKGKTERVRFSFTLLPYALPPQRTEFTQWLHTDCIADVHKTRVFSEKHWHLLEGYLRLAGENGITSILTPVFTPPLDTAVGGERTTVQLVGIEKNGETYSFDFSLLRRFTACVRAAGIEKLEIAHLFTQWGAGFAPKILVTENGRKKKLFGWKTPAMSDAYRNFLTQFLPALIRELEYEGYDESRVLFHISDEPNETHLEAYKNAVELVRPLVGEYPIMDALSKFDFYEHGLVARPVVAITHLTPFLNAKVPHLWSYYCCSQGERVSNRFMAMPAPRTRILGLQMYKFGIEGFLHWGFNFYSTQHSKQKIDPYLVTDAGGAFPSGDSFSVYPYKDGAIPSTRLIVFKSALDDIRLLSMIEAKLGRAETVALVDKICECDLSFTEYPLDGACFYRLREEAARILADS